MLINFIHFTIYRNNKNKNKILKFKWSFKCLESERRKVENRKLRADTVFYLFISMIFTMSTNYEDVVFLSRYQTISHHIQLRKRQFRNSNHSNK